MVLISKTLRVFWWACVFLFLIVIDQSSKYITVDSYHNRDFAFSLPVPLYLMYGIYFAGIGLIINYLVKDHRSLPRINLIAWTLILAGAVSNVGERIVLGFVRDWIYIGTGIFNLADGYIILGIIILLAQSVKRKA